MKATHRIKELKKVLNTMMRKRKNINMFRIHLVEFLHLLRRWKNVSHAVAWR